MVKARMDVLQSHTIYSGFLLWNFIWCVDQIRDGIPGEGFAFQ